MRLDIGASLPVADWLEGELHPFGQKNMMVIGLWFMLREIELAALTPVLAPPSWGRAPFVG